MKRYTLKKHRRKYSKNKKQSGRGYSDGPDWIRMASGNLVHHPYSGPGKDCIGDPLSVARPGYITHLNQYGLPGWKGGKRRRGGTQLYPASTLPMGPAMGPAPGQTVTPVTNATNPVTNAAVTQSGGRYGFFPELGPLNPVNGVGIYPAPFGRIPCEAGTSNRMNLNPNGIQTMTTSPSMPPYVRGGSRSRRSRSSRRRKSRKSRGGTLTGSSIHESFPTVQVGQKDSVSYYAPTAGYRNDFMTFSSPSAVPGLTLQTPYEARSFNQACIKGGSRKRYRK
jgi:hypothetical protein